MTANDMGTARALQALRPQTLVISFLGLYLLGRERAIYSGSFIDVLSRVDVSEDAVRSTLARMVNRRLLCRHRLGRRAYFGLTPSAEKILQDGLDRIWETGAINNQWDGTWTLVGYSLPDTRRSERHDLRSRLAWAGFGLLQSGLWIAPGVKDVSHIVDELGLRDHVTVLTGHAHAPSAARDLMAKAFDLAAITGHYQAFLDRWDTARPMPEAPDDLARQLLLYSDWLQVIRRDPHLPSQHLPADWPSIRAEKVFLSLVSRYERPARTSADAVIDEIHAG